MDDRSFASKMKLLLKRDWKNLYFPEEEIKEYPLSEMVEKLLRTGDDLLWAQNYVFASDPIAGAIPSRQAGDLCRRALDCGYEQAEAVRSRYGDLSVAEICTCLGAKVTEDLEDLEGSHIRFAEYVKSDSIRINPICGKRAKKLIKEQCANTPLTKTDPFEVLLAHELYHYLEEQNKELFTTSYRHKTGRAATFGPARIRSLSEIGAGAFAARLLGFHYPSYVYDVVFTYCFTPKQACKLYEKMCRRLSEKN